MPAQLTAPVILVRSPGRSYGLDRPIKCQDVTNFLNKGRNCYPYTNENSKIQTNEMIHMLTATGKSKYLDFCLFNAKRAFFQSANDMVIS